MMRITVKQDLADRSQRSAERAELLTSLTEVTVHDSESAAHVDIENQRHAYIFKPT